MENLVRLSFSPDNDILNSSEIDTDSTPASITELLCNKVFGESFAVWLTSLTNSPLVVRAL